MFSEDKNTKDQLNESNYKLWKQYIYLLLKDNDLIDFIFKKQLEKVSLSDLTPEQQSSMILVDFTSNTYYKSVTKKELIKKNTKAEKLLINSINIGIAANIDIITSTEYEIYNLIKGLNKSDNNDRIEELKNSLYRTRYNESGSLSMFISNMNMKFTELERLNVTLKDTDKIDYLYNAVSEELATKSTLLKESTWENATKNIIETYQRLKKLKEKRNKQKEIVSNSVNVEANNTAQQSKQKESVKYP